MRPGEAPAVPPPGWTRFVEPDSVLDVCPSCDFERAFGGSSKKDSTK
jgi:hypothetical protein